MPNAKPDSHMARLAVSVNKGVPMISVPDIVSTLDWYASIGFKEIGRYEDDDVANFGMLAFGKAEIMLHPGGVRGPHDVSLWFYTDRLDDLYRTLKSRREPNDREEIEFVEDIYDAFYGAREFGIRDLNGYILYFIQPKAA